MSIRILSFFTAFLLLGLTYLSARVRLAEMPERHTAWVVPVKRAFQNGNPIFSNEKIVISGLYPNPVAAVATLEYEISGDVKDVKIIVASVLGNTLAEHKLVKEMRKLQFSTSDYPPGIYFYTLSVDGKNMCTRKLIVRHQ